MTALVDFHRTVQTAIASKRVGAPVFVRYLYHATLKGPGVASRLARTCATVRDWLGQPIERIVAQGSEAGRHITLVLECRGGATALVTWVGTAGRGDGIDLTLVGNRGTIYHDAGASVLWDDPLTPDEAAPDRDMLAWIERAIRTQRPEGANP